MKALMISTIKITDPAGFQKYMEKTQQIARPYGAELVFRGKRSATLNGTETDGTMVVVVGFPDIDALERWNNSLEYQDIVALRDSSSVQVMTAYGPLE